MPCARTGAPAKDHRDRLEGDSHARDHAAGPGRLVLPASQQLEQRLLVASSFFSGWRSIPGTIAATSQLDWLISMTAMSIGSIIQLAADLLRSFR